MKTYSLIVSVFLCLSLPTLNGCAALGLNHLNPFGGDKEKEVDEDPVATAAARFRSPASAPLSASREETTMSYGSSSEESAPPESISLGMAMQDVLAAWGEPRDIETAGNRNEGNQRWTYFTGLSSRWSVSSQRVVFFENGRVAGWKNGN